MNSRLSSCQNADNDIKKDLDRIHAEHVRLAALYNSKAKLPLMKAVSVLVSELSRRVVRSFCRGRGGSQ